VYIAEVESRDLAECHHRSTHKRSLPHVQKLQENWQKTPKSFNRVDLTSMAQDAQIENVINL